MPGAQVLLVTPLRGGVEEGKSKKHDKPKVVFDRGWYKIKEKEIMVAGRSPLLTIDGGVDVDKRTVAKYFYTFL